MHKSEHNKRNTTVSTNKPTLQQKQQRAVAQHHNNIKSLVQQQLCLSPSYESGGYSIAQVRTRTQQNSQKKQVSTATTQQQVSTETAPAPQHHNNDRQHHTNTTQLKQHGRLARLIFFAWEVRHSSHKLAMEKFGSTAT